VIGSTSQRPSSCCVYADQGRIPLGPDRCRNALPSLPCGHEVARPHILHRHLTTQGGYTFSLTYAPGALQILALDPEPAVLGGGDADDVTGPHLELGETLVPVLDQFALAALDLFDVGAERGEDAGLALDAHRPRVGVDGSDDAPFAGLGVGEDPLGEGVRPGPRLPAAAAPGEIPDTPPAVGGRLLGPGLRPPCLAELGSEVALLLDRVRDHPVDRIRGNGSRRQILRGGGGAPGHGTTPGVS
jgi:hypothetical protein